MAWPKRRSSRGRDDIKDNPPRPSHSSRSLSSPPSQPPASSSFSPSLVLHRHLLSPPRLFARESQQRDQPPSSTKHNPAYPSQMQDQPRSQYSEQPLSPLQPAQESHSRSRIAQPDPSQRLHQSSAPAGPPHSYRYSAAQYAPQPGVQYYARYDLATYKFGTAEQTPASPSSSSHSHRHSDSASSNNSTNDERDGQFATTDITPRPSVFDTSRTHHGPYGSHPSQPLEEPPNPGVLTDRLRHTQATSHAPPYQDTDTDTFGASISVTSFSSRDDSRASGTRSRTGSSARQSSQSVPIDSDFSDEQEHRHPLPITSSINSSSPERSTHDYYRTYSHESFTDSEDMYNMDTDSDLGSGSGSDNDSSARARIERIEISSAQYEEGYNAQEAQFNSHRGPRNEPVGWEHQRHNYLSEASIARESDSPPPITSPAPTSLLDPTELTRELTQPGGIEAPGFGTARDGPTSATGRGREDSIGTLRRLSRSVGHPGPTGLPPVPVPGGDGNWSTRETRSPEPQAVAGTHTAPSTTAVSSTSQSAGMSSALDGFDADLLDMSRGITMGDTDFLVREGIVRASAAGPALPFDAVCVAPQGKSGSGHEESEGKVKKKWYSRWIGGGHKEERTASSGASVTAGRKLSTISVMQDTFNKQLAQWDAVSYNVQKKEWTFKRERADRLRGVDGGEVDPLIAPRLSGEDSPPIPNRFQKGPNLAGFTTIHDGTAEPPLNQDYMDTLREVNEADRARIREKEKEELEKEREKRMKTSSLMWKGMALNSQEIWRNELIGRFKVDRKAIKSQTTDYPKPAQQRLMVSNFRDGFIKVPGVGPPITIHKHSRASAFSISRHYRPRAPTPPPLVPTPLPLQPVISQEDPSAQTHPPPLPPAPEPPKHAIHKLYGGAPQPRKGTMILLAPLRVQQSFTNTATTRKLADYGYLKDNDPVSPPTFNEGHQDRERQRERRRERGGDRDKQNREREERRREREREAEKVRVKQMKMKQKEDKKRRKAEEVEMKMLGKGKSKQDLSQTQGSSSGGSTGAQSTSASQVAGPSISPPVAPPLVKSKSTSTTNSTTAVASTSASTSPTASGSASANASTSRLPYFPSAGPALAAGPSASAPASTSGDLQFEGSQIDYSTYASITPRRPRRRRKVLDALEPDTSTDEEDEGRRSDGPPPTRTPHNEAFSTIDASYLEYKRALMERSLQAQAASEAEKGGVVKRLLGRKQRSNPDLIGPNPAYLDSNFDPPWMTLPSRAKLEEQQRVVENLNESFKDVGLLPSGKRKKRTWRRRSENRDVTPVLADIPNDCLFMLIPLWPGETDHAHMRKLPPDWEKPNIPVHEREYLLVHYRSTSADILRKLDEEASGGRTAYAHEAYLRRQAERARTENPGDDRSVLLTSFNVCAKLVTYGELTGSGIRRPDEGLAVTGLLDVAYEQLPKLMRPKPHEGTDVIGICHSRESGFEFIPHGLRRMGLCAEVPPDPEQVAAAIVGADHPEPDLPDPTLVLTPIGRAALEMVWLGCLAVTSFGPSVEAKHKH